MIPWSHSQQNACSKRQPRRSLKVPPQVRDFCYEAAASGRNTVEEISSFLTSNGFSSTGTSIKLVEQKLSFKPLSIERQLQPMLAWLLGLGLTRAESLKVIICCPQILRLNIAENLKPTCEWLLEFGLSRHQLAKAILRRPSILTCSLERKLKPTVRFLATLGLSTDKIAKAVVSYPQILGLSIQQNLKPTLRWFSSLGPGERTHREDYFLPSSNCWIQYSEEAGAHGPVVFGHWPEQKPNVEVRCEFSTINWPQCSRKPQR